MTIQSESVKAGPFDGNDSTTVFPFTFKVFQAADLEVYHTDINDNDVLLVLDTDYSVSLNADQEASPGGSVTYPVSGSPLATGEKLTVLNAVEYLQGTDLQNGGAWNPETVENALDRLTMLAQRLNEENERGARAPVSDDGTTDYTLPAYEAGQAIIWDPLLKKFVNGSAPSFLEPPFAIFTTVADMLAAEIPVARTITVQSYYTAVVPFNNAGGADYLVVSAAAFGGSPDEKGDHTLANGNIAVLQSDGKINVKQYGAKGDSSTDDYTAIKAASNKWEVVGGDLYFPVSNGFYITGTAWTAVHKAYSRIFSEGATVKSSATIDHILKLDNREAYSVSIEGVQFIASATSTITDVVVVDGGQQLIIKRSRFITDATNTNLLQLSDNIFLGGIYNSHFDGFDSSAYGIYTVTSTNPGASQPNGFLLQNSWLKNCDICLFGQTKFGTGWISIANWYEDSNLSVQMNSSDGFLSIKDTHETLKGYVINVDDAMIIAPVVGSATMTKLLEINGENCQLINPNMTAAQPTALFTAETSAVNFYVETYGAVPYTTNSKVGVVVDSASKKRLYGTVEAENASTVSRLNRLTTDGVIQVLQKDGTDLAYLISSASGFGIKTNNLNLLFNQGVDKPSKFYRANATTSTSAWQFISDVTSSETIHAIIRANGDIENTNNSYGALSDRKLKQDIVPAASQWDDVKAYGKLANNYRLKSEVAHDANAKEYLGFIAQEIKEISPGVVTEHISEDIFSEDVIDPKTGEVLIPGGELIKKGGESILGLKYSIMYLKATIALGEALERIESLEDRLTAAGL